MADKTENFSVYKLSKNWLNFDWIFTAFLLNFDWIEDCTKYLECLN